MVRSASPLSSNLARSLRLSGFFALIQLHRLCLRLFGLEQISRYVIVCACRCVCDGTVNALTAVSACPRCYVSQTDVIAE